MMTTVPLPLECGLPNRTWENNAKGLTIAKS